MIVRALVTTYGGEITVKSEGLNQGTAFSFSMMMEEEDPLDEPLHSLKSNAQIHSSTRTLQGRESISSNSNLLSTAKVPFKVIKFEKRSSNTTPI